MILALFMNMAYNTVLRSHLIKPTFEKPIDSLQQVDYINKPVFCTNTVWQAKPLVIDLIALIYIFLFSLSEKNDAKIPIDFKINRLIYLFDYCDIDDYIPRLPENERERLIETNLSFMHSCKSV